MYHKNVLNENLTFVKLSSTNYPNVKFDTDGTQNDSVNKALLDDIQKAAKSAGVVVTITTAKSGHKRNVKGSKRKSRHMDGVAVDISIINGEGSNKATNSTDGNPNFRNLGTKFKDALVSMGYKWNSESGNDKAVLWQTNIGGNHYNHLHISNKSGQSTKDPKSEEKGKKLTGQLAFKNYSGQAANNIKLILTKLKKEGVTDPITQVAILSTIGKESGFIPQNEIGYCKSTDSSIVNIFGSRGRKCKSLKCDDEKFFECVYGPKSGVKLGNVNPGDGYKFRGRGFNQITGRGNYRAYGYENNPEALNNVEGAADAAIKFLTQGKGSSLNNKFKNLDDAIKYFVDINAGGTASNRSFKNAKKVASNFTFDGVESIEDIDTDSSGLLDVLASDGKGPGTFLDIFKTLGDVLSPDKKIKIEEDINRINDLIKKVL